MYISRNSEFPVSNVSIFLGVTKQNGGGQQPVTIQIRVDHPHETWQWLQGWFGKANIFRPKS